MAKNTHEATIVGSIGCALIVGIGLALALTYSDDRPHGAAEYETAALERQFRCGSGYGAIYVVPTGERVLLTTGGAAVLLPALPKVEH